jgi:hypothetical protein
LWPYLFVALILITIFFISRVQLFNNTDHAALERSSLKLIAVLLICMLGLRHEVGSDWESYLKYLDTLRGKAFSEAFTVNEPGYLILNWLAANVWGSIYTVNIICAALLMWGVDSFSRCQPRPQLSLIACFPYLLIVVGMGYTRQSVAIGLVMLAIVAVYKNNYWKFIGWVILASLFHKTALIFLIIGVFIKEHNKILGVLIIGSISGIVYVIQHETINASFKIYLEGDYESAGALYRLAIIAGSGILFLLYQHRFSYSVRVKKMWSALSWTGLLLLLLLFCFPKNATLIDRIGLYWLPLQFMVLSHLPSIWKIRINKIMYGELVVVAYSVIVMLTWLTYSKNSQAWIPYQLYPW